MLAMYLFSLAFGITVIGALMMMGGGKDSDGDGDADHGDADHGDADHDGEGDGDHAPGQAVSAAAAHAPTEKGDLLRVGSVRMLLSIRFWTFFLAAFGAVGTTATLLGVPAIATFLAAVVTGGGVGTGAGFLFRALREDRVSAATDLASFAGEEAVVTVAIRPGSRGRIRLQLPSGTRELLATSRDGRLLEPGAKVLITEVRDGVADVTPERPTPKGPPQAVPEKPHA